VSRRGLRLLDISTLQRITFFLIIAGRSFINTGLFCKLKWLHYHSCLYIYICCWLSTNEFLLFNFFTCLVEWEWRICDFSSPEYKTDQPPGVGLLNSPYFKMHSFLNSIFVPIGLYLNFTVFWKFRNIKILNKFSSLAANSLMLIPMP